MKKKLILLFLFFSFTLKIFPYDIYGSFGSGCMYSIKLFEDGTGLIYYDYVGIHEPLKFNYQHIKKNNIDYIYFNEKLFPNDIEIDKLLILFGSEIRYGKNATFVLCYDNLKSLLFYDAARSFEISREYYDCTSFLTEGEIKYDISNLNGISLEHPWVEGVKGYGKNEGFTIKGNDHYLLFVNGFVSFDKPYLYEQNSRVKEVKVIGSKSGKEKIFTLLDTPNPQSIDISFLDDNDDTIVRIESVYPGTKYDDTCISVCILYRYEVIPFQD